jgi:chorismate lyase / 3-hydroxybenzoate synthase
MQGLADLTELLVSSAVMPSSAASHSTAVAPHMLGQMTFGLQCHASDIASIRQHLYAEPLHPIGSVHPELWLSKAPTRAWQESGMQCQGNDDVLFGVIEIPEPLHTEDGIRPLEQITHIAYHQLFETLDKHDYKYLWRAWNYMPQITEVTHGLERYQQFNLGRQQGFASSARTVTGNVPAACALGVRSGPLSVAFLAGRTPTLPIENPRQVSAYHYPQQYGPQSPTFSRASLAQLHQQELLLLSGTASIVGHETLHIGDVKSQTLETLTNIQAVLSQANLRSKSANGYRLQDLLMRVYVRHAKDVNLIRSVINERLGTDHSALYLHADICRADLDVEIEGIAWQAISTTPTT